MITYTQGNLIASDAEALVNTVNTVGVMGKGIALMFKEAFPDNYRAYQEACARGEVRVGRVFVVERQRLTGPRWIINFPTKKHWRNPSKLEWVREGLKDLRRVISQHGIRSIAIPPLGAGNGGLDWAEVRPVIAAELADLDVAVTVYEPTSAYQNVAKKEGVEKPTPARALISELVRRYTVLGLGCSLLEIQKLAYFLDKSLKSELGVSPLRLDFKANRYGPYDAKLPHLLNSLDGSYLRSDKRISDCGAFDEIGFNDAKRDLVATFLNSSGKEFLPALARTTDLIDGFESPLGMELLATVDWLLSQEGVAPDVKAIQTALKQWPDGAGDRKLKIFEPDMIAGAIEQLRSQPWLDITPAA